MAFRCIVRSHEVVMLLCHSFVNRQYTTSAEQTLALYERLYGNKID